MANNTPDPTPPPTVSSTREQYRSVQSISLDDSTDDGTGSSNRISQNLSTTNRLPEFRRTRIHSRDDLQRGDHVAWHRMWGYWHHAIFSEIDCDRPHKMYVYQQSWNDTIKDANFHKESVVFRSSTDVVYRITYVDRISEKDTRLTMARAKWLAREWDASTTLLERDKTYDILDNNCEHSVRWCKTGVHVSTQVEDLTGPTGCVTLSVKSVLLLLMRLCGLLVLFSIEAVFPDDSEKILEVTTFATSEESIGLSFDHHTKELILAVVYTIFNAIAFMVYQLYIKCKEIKEIDEPDDIEPNVCYICCVRCNGYTYGRNCTARGEKCYANRLCKGSNSCSIFCWLCCVCCCKTPCLNAERRLNYISNNANRQALESHSLRGPHGCCVIKTRLCCKLYAGDVLMIMFREIVCVGTPLAIMILVHVYFGGAYSELQKAGIGLAIALGSVPLVYICVYFIMQCIRCSLVCTIRRCLRCCQPLNHYDPLPDVNVA